MDAFFANRKFFAIGEGEFVEMSEMRPVSCGCKDERDFIACFHRILRPASPHEFPRIDSLDRPMDYVALIVLHIQIDETMRVDPLERGYRSL